jgi:carboxypeptidase C (cathepsin A)
MMPKHLHPLALVVCLGFAIPLASARSTQTAPEGSAPAAASQPSKSGHENEKDKGKDEKVEPFKGTVENASTTEHDITIDGQKLHYKATAAKMLMKDDSGKVRANIFFVAYDKDRPADSDPADRPITFLFNGGPGAAAVWLHIGAVGPRRVELGENSLPVGPPYRLIDNPQTWLAESDLVFIDPVGTGFSRAAEGEKAEQFYGVKEDINSVSEFIRLYITHFQRWSSPMFLAGESYGTTRAAGLSEHLIDRYGIAVNGIVFISTVLDFQTLEPGDANDLPYPLYLPSYAAAAWYHKRLAPELQADLKRTLAQVEKWSTQTYMVALARGSELPAGDRRQVVEKLAQYTGLPAEFIERNNLRISPGAFQKQLLIADRKTIGRFDARITGFDLEPAYNRPMYDPSLSYYLPLYTSTFNDYVRRVLKFESDLPYEVLSGKVQPWKMGEPGSGYLSVTDDLRSAMAKNPRLQVMFASGYFDLATPYSATTFTVDHMDLSPELRGHIRHNFYMGGHMMYHDLPSLEKLNTDVKDFIRSSVR